MIQINEERLLKEFLEFVQIDSESCNEKAMGERLCQVLKDLGLEPITDEAGKTYNSNGFNVFARLPGEGEPMVLTAHMDTVVPGNGVKPEIRDGVIYSDGTTVLGGDDKSGICGILEAVRVILENKLPHRPAEIIFSIGEEGGMRGAKAFDCSQLKSKRAYVFDSSGEVGKVIVGAPGQIKIFADVVGRRAHAGIAPEDGISAIQVMSKAIAKMNLLRIDEETTCNIGSIKAEYPTNIVPDRCSIIAEVRSRNADKLNAHEAHIHKCLQDACDEAGATLEYNPMTNYVAYNVSEDSETVKLIAQAIEKAGHTPHTALGGGGSDANVYNLKGIETVVLGTGMTKVRTTDECLKIQDLNDTARVILALLTL